MGMVRVRVFICGSCSDSVTSLYAYHCQCKDFRQALRLLVHLKTQKGRHNQHKKTSF